MSTRHGVPQHDSTTLIVADNMDIDAIHGNCGVECLRHSVLLVFGALPSILLLVGTGARPIPLAELEVSERVACIRQPARRAASKVQPTFESCKIHEEAAGLLMNTDTKQPFSYKDACVAHDPHTGYDPAAAQEAKDAVKDLFRKVFQLN